MQKLLAINFGGIGDEILFLPTLATIKNAHPHWEITLLCEPRSSSIKDITNLIDNVVLFDIKKRPFFSTDLVDLLVLIRNGGYDKVISSGSSPLVSLLLFLSGIRTRIGYNSGWLSNFLLTQSVRLKRNQYAGNMYHDLVQGLGLPKGNVVPKIETNNVSEARIKDFLRSTAKVLEPIGTKRILIHPGSSLLALQKKIYKTWAAENWALLIERLLDVNEPAISVILAGGPDDHQTIEEINLKLNKKHLATRVVSAVGVTTSLSDLAALIKACDLLVCVDSAPMHLAVGLGKPLVSLFGPTEPAKLLPKSNLFCAISDHSGPATADLKENSNRIKSTKLPSQDGRGVQLPPDIVFQSVLDQLRQASSQEHPRESCLV